MMDDAIEHNNETMIDKYIHSNYDMNYKDKDGLTPLEFAVTHNKPKTVAALLKSPNVSRGTITAATAAADEITYEPMRKQIISLLNSTNIESNNDVSIPEESKESNESNESDESEESKNDESNESKNDESEESKNDESNESKNEDSNNDESDSDDEDNFEETPSYTNAINKRNASRTLKNTNLTGGSKNKNKTLKRRRFNIRLV